MVLPLEMDPAASVDIDDAADLALAEFYLNRWTAAQP
jgi:CMP-N-acetylneuraminic acid synthetase